MVPSQSLMVCVGNIDGGTFSHHTHEHSLSLPVPLTWESMGHRVCGPESICWLWFYFIGCWKLG